MIQASLIPTAIPPASYHFWKLGPFLFSQHQPSLLLLLLLLLLVGAASLKAFSIKKPAQPPFIQARGVPINQSVSGEAKGICRRAVHRLPTGSDLQEPSSLKPSMGISFIRYSVYLWIPIVIVTVGYSF